ncbi:MAG: hypothetical protein JRG90_16875 [Deltaproteobacteria bacterium]|nr:hypothetical protein [Deltaproteobacteria bacterium]
MRKPIRQPIICALLAVVLLSAAFSAPSTTRADDLGIEVPSPKPATQMLEQPPEYGVYWDRYEPTFYTGFAPRTLEPARLHLHVGRGNQLRATAVLSEEVLEGYARDLDARRATYRALIDQKRLVPSQNGSFSQMETTLEEVDLTDRIKDEKMRDPAEIRAANVELMKRLNPGRVFEIDIPEQALLEAWITGLAPADRSTLDRDRSLELVNALLPTRLWIAELDAATKKELHALAKLAPQSDLGGAEAEGSDAFREAYFALLERLTGDRYPRTNGWIRFVEFTAIYPIGTFNDYTEYKGHKIPLYPTPGRRALTTHQRTKTPDHIPTKANYSYSPWLPYMHVGKTMHNSFHTLWWRMEPEQTAFLPSQWTENDPRRKTGPSRYLWLLSRGPMSHGCTHVNVGHIAELRQLLPPEVAKLYEVDVFLNRSYNYDVFDIDGDMTPEVMGVEYFIAFSLKQKKAHKLRVRNERRAFYQWLYGSELRYHDDGSAWFPEVQDGRFVERTAKRGANYQGLDLYEAAYEPEKIQFYRLIDIDFARRLRQIALTHPFRETTAAAKAN